ncbi:MAG: adenine phosphoribosyltransferase [Chloroflexi bacterium]|nr:adenine phosphoribosyltransferase [Chloroflexota bacterium]
MNSDGETYRVKIGGIQRELPLVEVAPGVRIAVFNILGDTELVEACAQGMQIKLQDIAFDLLVTAEAKSIPLIHALSSRMRKPYIVLRKAYKIYMGHAIEAETLSITTGKPQKLFLDEKDHELADGKRIVLIDDVISTGSTLAGMRKVMEMAGSEVVAEAAVYTEGDAEKWKEIIALGHLPLFMDD